MNFEMCSKHLCGVRIKLKRLLYRYIIYKITVFQCLNNKTITVTFLFMCYRLFNYYFLGLNIGNEHKSMFYGTLQKHGLPREKKLKAF